MLLPIIDHLPLGAFVVDRDCTVLRWNRIIEEWARVLRSEIESTPLGARFPRFRLPRYRQAIDDCLQDGAPPIIFSPVIHKDLIPTYKPDGSRRTQIVSLSSLVMPESPPLGLFVIQDISDIAHKNLELVAARKSAQIEAQRRAHAEELLAEARRRESMATLATEFAHVVNNRLQVIQSSAETAARFLDAPDAARRQLERIVSSCQDAGGLSQALLELAQEEGSTPGSIALLPVLRAAADAAATQTGVHIRLGLAGDMPEEAHWVRVSRRSLDKILAAVLVAMAGALGTDCAEPVCIDVDRQASYGDLPAQEEGYVVVSVGVDRQGMGAEAGRSAAEPSAGSFQRAAGMHLTIARERAKRFGGDIVQLGGEGTPLSVQIVLPAGDH